MRTKDKIQKQLEENPIMLYMKGTPSEPKCGFSAKASAALNSTDINYAYLDILSAPLLKEGLKEYSDFPTFPQLYIKGELIGGSDIIVAMVESGELLPMLQGAKS
jgi:monothiol glutaredoxin